MINCDICGSKIENGKCLCGTWKSKEEMENCPIRKSLEKFHEMKGFTLSGDAPHLGCAVVYFRGYYNDCVKVKEFIYSMKSGPYYNQAPL